MRSNKAEALAAKLRVDYPHGRFAAFPVSAQTMLAAHEGCHDENDLIVSCMGDWRGETLLNDWHCRRGRPMPVVYGWTESHAAAGHAVAIVHGGGCLQCGLGRTGVPEFQVVNWPNDAGTTLEEPACGAHYQPYGPIELGFVSSLFAQLALDGLLGKIAISSARIYAALRSTVEDLGGRWTADWVREYPARVDVGAFVDRAWPSGPCVACRRPKNGPAEF